MKKEDELELSLPLFIKEAEYSSSVSLIPGVYKAGQGLINDIAVVMSHELCRIGVDKKFLEYLSVSEEIRIDILCSDAKGINDRVNNLLDQLKRHDYWYKYSESIVQIRYSNQYHINSNEFKLLMMDINKYLPSSSGICFSMRIDDSMESDIQLLIICSQPVDIDDAIIQRFKKHHQKDFKSSFGKYSAFHDLLYMRKWRLDKSFDFSKENMEKLQKIDELLRASSQAVAKKTEKVFNEAKQRVEADGFTHDFEIEAFIRPNIDALWQDNHTTMLEIIDEVWTNSNLYSGKGGSAFYDSCNAVECLNELEMDEGRCITNTALDNLKFCWAFYNLIKHSPYALIDILRIPMFWNEVQIRYQNFAENQ